RIGRIVEKTSTINVNTLLAEVVEMLAPVAPVTIDIIIQPDMPIVTGEYTQIQQVFQNLLENAIKYMGAPAGKITVTHEDAGDYWQFCVRDTGQGIDPKYHDRIFRIFQTLSSHDESDNTGIGL